MPGDTPLPRGPLPLVSAVVEHVRRRHGPCLLRSTVLRLQVTSFEDTQTYKSKNIIVAGGVRSPAKIALAPTVGAGCERVGSDYGAGAARRQSCARRCRGATVADPKTATRHFFLEAGDLQGWLSRRPAAMSRRCPTRSRRPRCTEVTRLRVPRFVIQPDGEFPAFIRPL